jgi:Mrp family chromosome partitioning ATPase
MFGAGLGPTSLADVVDPTYGFDQQRFRESVVKVAPHLHLFRASATPIAGPAEFIASSAMDVILEAVGDSYDTVVIDSPPAGLVTDATILASKVDAVLFVVSHGQTNRRFVRRALREIARVDANVIGTVMNQFPTDRARIRRAQGYLGGGYSSLPAIAPQA